ncbi:Calcium-independent phospholipase A2-gamma [Pseudocercospora fuligena]|uniref:Calcium-independent phospholipase A2-gamma n=1 Tax=Pseudocercospora fuligena TaxID=685502 RepID=A0A8H6RWZ1_9PEZI|nr:Calcium-independent phospholipase A2-gamma [Pseudocercospora fuligena]
MFQMAKRILSFLGFEELGPMQEARPVEQQVPAETPRHGGAPSRHWVQEPEAVDEEAESVLDRRSTVSESDRTLHSSHHSSQTTCCNFPPRGDSLTAKPEDPWARRTILSLDGGGIRGFPSLLILEELMNRIKSLEQSGDYGLPHSNSSQCDQSLDFDGDCEYRPHHYFDYFVGTSTGGLSAIMLGRLQMTVTDALKLYNDIGTHVFGHPRPQWLPKAVRGYTRYVYDRYDEERMEEALRDAIHPHLAGEVKRTKVNWPDVSLTNENPYAAQTVVTTWGGDGVNSPRLFRSYNHPTPMPDLPTTEKERHLEPHRACSAPLWAVARATSAAPTYFRRIKIGNDDYWDGAVGQDCNNPIRLAYHEVEQMHPRSKPSVIVSIGTGTQPRKEQPPPEKGLSLTLYLAKQMQRSSTNSEKVHRDFKHDLNRYINEHLSKEGKVEYARFNPDGIHGVKLDQWLPASGPDAGATTKDTMRREVEKYLAESEVSNELDRMAKMLVEKRRRRTHTCERWERFARHVPYACHEDEKCRNESLFRTREELRDHAFHEHGIVWQIDTRHGAKYHDKDYACKWDGCGQISLPVFRCKEDFEDHLTRHHGLKTTRVLSYEDYEAWLDAGRKRGESSSEQGSSSSISSRDSPRADAPD